MDERSFVLAEEFLPKSYLKQASEAASQRTKLINTLLAQVNKNTSKPTSFLTHIPCFQRRLPKVGWDEATLEFFLQQLALMDSNNFLGKLHRSISEFSINQIGKANFLQPMLELVNGKHVWLVL